MPFFSRYSLHVWDFFRSWRCHSNRFTWRGSQEWWKCRCTPSELLPARSFMPNALCILCVVTWLWLMITDHTVNIRRGIVNKSHYSVWSVRWAVPFIQYRSVSVKKRRWDGGYFLTACEADTFAWPICPSRTFGSGVSGLGVTLGVLVWFGRGVKTSIFNCWRPL